MQRIDGNNVTTNYLYSDAESQLTDIQYPATPNLNAHFAYDAYGRRASMMDATGSQSYVYGNLDELQSVTTTYTSLPAQVFSYAYYPNGSRQSLTTSVGTFNYSYDGAGRMTGLTNPFGEASSWAYQNNNWLSTQTLANGAPTSYAYNALGQMVELTNKTSAGAVLSQFTSMVHDAAGNRTSLTASLPAVPTFSGVTNYQYDTKDQLIQEQSTRNSGYTDNFGYDAAGNPTNFKGTTKTYNTNNQQTATGFAHDGNGNPTIYNGVNLSFDAENRLTSYGSVLTAGYTGDGLRAWKQTASGRTYFLDDGTLPVVEMDASGNVIATNTFGAHGLVSRHASTTSTFYTFDAQGSVSQQLDAAGATLSTHQFAAHGAELSAPSSDPFGYDAQWGYYTDRETGLQLLTHRYYDPANGRFLTRDPISYNGGINLYAYVANNPIGFIDPHGLDIAIIENGPTSYTPFWGGNPIGHTAIAVTGYGVFSFGNWAPFGSSLADYIRHELPNRNTTIYVIKTTPEQDKAVVEAFKKAAAKGYKWSENNCSHVANAALDAIDIPYKTITGAAQPGTAGRRAEDYGATMMEFPQNSNLLLTDLMALKQFEPH